MYERKTQVVSFSEQPYTNRPPKKSIDKRSKA
jgi:hypothetical protein